MATVTARQAAALLACSPGFVRRLARSGHLQGHKAGPVWLIDRASLDAYRYGVGDAHDGPTELDRGDR
ncbi:helix-turn-helix domain-containing protein [Streptomyces sp. NBC_01506]|uniref:helix-turn-helix domain-containing protein n=1 Tax=Streptomyces sp. NBC_01506 TaxID=2903887 RepID=UPI00386B9C06